MDALLKPARKIFLFTLCLCLLLSLAACGSDTPVTVEAPPSSGLIDVGEIIETLSASEMRGRLTGTAENEAAAEYLRGLFALLDLSPFDGDDFFHAYRQEIFDIEAANTRLTVTLADGTERALQLGSEFQFRADQGPVDVRLTAVSDLIGLGEAGREERIYIPGEMGLMTIWGSSQWPPPVQWAVSPQESPAVLAPWGGLEREDGTIYFPLGDFGHDPDFSVLNIDAEVFDALMEIGITEMHLQSEDVRRVETVHNVIGLLEGRDRSRAVVISAHFDGTGFIGDIYTQAAIDNASGIAAILYAASILGERRDELKIDVVFAAFNGEEGGLLGSFAFAPEAAARYDELYNLNIDCVGVIDWVDYSICAANSTNNALRNAFREKMDMSGFAYNFMPYGWSDHLPFERLGFPALSFGQIDRRIHSAEDRAEFLDLEEIERVGRLVANFVLANGTETFQAGLDFIPGQLATGEDMVAQQIERVLEAIGGLAYYEAYQFRLPNRQYVILTGFRPLLSVAEVQRYYPDIILPEQVEEFTFQYFVTFGQGMEPMIGDGPFQQGRINQDPDELEDLPCQEVFVRPLTVHAFSAVYANPLGERILLSVSPGSHVEWCGDFILCTIHAGLHFLEIPEEGYRRAIYTSEIRDMDVTLELVGENNPYEVEKDPLTYRFVYMEFDQLLALAELFGLHDMAERYGWQLIPWDDVTSVFWFSGACPDWI